MTHSPSPRAGLAPAHNLAGYLWSWLDAAIVYIVFLAASLGPMVWRHKLKWSNLRYQAYPLYSPLRFIVIPLILILLIKVWGMTSARWRMSSFAAMCGVAIVLGFAVYVYGYHGPDRSSRSDRHDAIMVGWRLLVSGHNPYEGRTHLNNTIAPMIGGMILATPFMVLLGGLFLQGLTWLYGTVFGVGKFLSKQAAFAIAAVLVLSPTFRMELVIQSDGWVNAANILVFGTAGWLLARRWGTTKWWSAAFVLAAVLLGFALAYRLNYSVAVLPLLAAMWRRFGKTPTLVFGGVAAAVSVPVALIPYFINPSLYAPFNKPAEMGSGMIANWHVVIGLSTLLVIVWGTLFARTLRGVWLTAGVAMAVFIIAGATGRQSFASYEAWAYNASAYLYLLVGLSLPKSGASGLVPLWRAWCGQEVDQLPCQETTEIAEAGIVS